MSAWYPSIWPNWNETPPRKPKYRRKGTRAVELKPRAAHHICPFRKMTAAEGQELLLRWKRV